MSIDSIELATRFTYHAPHGNQLERYQAIREAALQFAYTILALTPASREQSLSITALEECSMWANAAIARREDQAPSSSPAPFSPAWLEIHEAGLLWALGEMKSEITAEKLSKVMQGQASIETCQAWLISRGYLVASGQGEDQAEGK